MILGRRVCSLWRVELDQRVRMRCASRHHYPYRLQLSHEEPLSWLARLQPITFPAQRFSLVFGSRSVARPDLA